MSDLEKRFHKAMIGIYEEAKKNGYTPSYFLRMIADHGAVETARQLVNSEKPSDGFTRLYLRGRLDLSVEALIEKPDWWPLFTKSEREKAKKRLVENGCPAGD
jgi:hypothetical protein